MVICLLLVFRPRWLRRLQSTLAEAPVLVSSTHMEGLHSDGNEVVKLLCLPSCLWETNTIRRPVSCTVPQEATPVQEILLGFIQRISTVFPVLACRVLDANMWGSTTGTVMLAASRHLSFKMEFPIDEGEGVVILSQFINSLHPEGQEEEVDQD
jgi:hypothetical protein